MAMHEPSLFEMSRQDETAEVYRFLLLRTFRPPISVRLVVRKDGTALLISKGMPGKAGYEPGTMASLSKEQTEWFRDLVEGFAAWKLPTSGRNRT